MKQYHEELNADIKAIKGSMAMLGDVSEEDGEGGEKQREEEL